MRFSIAALACAALFLLPAASADAWWVGTHHNGVKIEANFSDPDIVGGSDWVPIHHHVARLIDSVPESGFIRMGLYSFDSPPVLDALRRATRRNIEVVQDGGQAANGLTGITGLTRRTCGGAGHTSCISNAGIQHNKYILFSQARDWDNVLHSKVAWFGSANLTEQTGAASFNDALTVYGDGDLYDKMRDRIWYPQWNQSPKTSDYYKGGCAGCQGYLKSVNSQIEMRMSPNIETGSSNDQIVENLNRVRVANGCEIQVTHNHFTRTDVAYKLADMRRGGCRVWVLVNHYSTEVRNILTNAGIAMRQRGNLHQKTITIGTSNVDGGLFDNVHWHTVLTGSQNLTFPARYQNDEILVTLSGSWDIYREYRRTGIRAWIPATPLNNHDYPSDIMW